MSGRARSGRRPGREDTRGTILEAARSTFATHGYHGATIRAIAAEAGVDPALVHHYFGPKEDLFAASIELPIRPAQAAEQALADGVDKIGANLARLFFSVWEAPASRDALVAMLRGAFTTDHGGEVLREFFGSVMVARIAPRLEVPDAEFRTSLAAAHLVGVAVLRYVVGLEPVAKASVEELVEMIGPRLQGYFTD